MYKQGEIVLIPVPFTDLSSSKKRPVLVISNDGYNDGCPDMIVLAITSNVTQPGVRITNGDMERGVLPKDSVIRSDKVYTLYQGIVVKRIGEASKAILKAVVDKTAEIIKLPTDSPQ
jgi:mRNA interferase MazF